MFYSASELRFLKTDDLIHTLYVNSRLLFRCEEPKLYDCFTHAWLLVCFYGVFILENQLTDVQSFKESASAAHIVCRL